MNWQKHPVSKMASLVNGTPFPADSFDSIGEVPLVRIRDLSSAEFDTFVPESIVPSEAIVRNGDVLVGMDGDFNVLRWNRGMAALNQRVCLLRVNNEVDSRFLAYSLPPHLKKINDLTYSTTVKHLSSRQVRGIRISTPALSEQEVICDYLDRETQKIDELIAQQRVLIELLQERRKALSETMFGKYVAGGSRLRWSLEDVDERADCGGLGLPLLSVSIDWGVRRRGSDIKQHEGDLARYKVARSGDIVLNRMRAFQGALGVAAEDGLVSPDYSVLRTSDIIDSRWLSLVMRSPSFVGNMVSRIRGIGGVDSGAVRTPRLNFSDLREISIFIPSRELQLDDVRTMYLEISRINELIADSEDLIALSQERRSALITAAVTGQIDVRTTA